MTPSDTTDSHVTTSRRAFLLTVGAGGAVTALGTGSAGAHRPLDSQLEQIRGKTERYKNPQKALDDGYQIMGPYVPGMGWHFLNPGNVEAAVDEDFDLNVPQLLTYGDAGGGFEELTLASVEYAIPVGARDYTDENPPNIFEDSDDSEIWHAHPAAEHALTLPVDLGHGHHAEDFPESPADVPPEDLIRGTNWIELIPGNPEQPMLEHGITIMANFAGSGPLDGRAVVGSSVHPDLLTLHAWVHEENPDGVFAPINPELANEPVD